MAKSNMLADVLQRLMHERGWSQGRLSRETQARDPSGAGIPQATISRILAGKHQPGAGHLRLLADTLEVSVDYLLGRETPAVTDTETPPLDLFRAAQFPDDLISDLQAAWPRYSPARRSDIIARAERMKTLHEESDGMLHSITVLL